jgi:hypothetical protein
MRHRPSPPAFLGVLAFAGSLGAAASCGGGTSGDAAQPTDNPPDASDASSHSDSPTGDSYVPDVQAPLDAKSDAPVLEAVRFPRIAAQMGAGAQNYGHDMSTLQAYLQHFDVSVIGGNWEGSAAGYGYSREKFVSGIVAGDGAVRPLLLQYNIDDNINFVDGSSAPGIGTPIWKAQVDAMAGFWYLWESGGGGTHVTNAYDPGKLWMTNSVDLGPGWKDSNGNGMEAAFAAYHDGYYRTGATADAAPSLSGVIHDNFAAVIGNSAGDYLHQNASTSPLEISVAKALFAGQAEFIQWYRAHAPGQHVAGNCDFANALSDDSHLLYQRPPSVIGPLNGALDSALNEASMGWTYSTEYWAGFEELVRLIQYNTAVVKSPQYNQILNENIDANGKDPFRTSTDGQALRYSFGVVLVSSDSCFSDAGGTGQSPRLVPGGYYPALDWFDWYAVDDATGIALDYGGSTSAQISAHRYWLGTAIDPPQTAATLGLCWARRFRTPSGRIALVLLNPSALKNPSAADQVVTLPPGTWQALTASTGTNVGRNSSVDDGATGLTKITVPVGDARIVLQ